MNDDYFLEYLLSQSAMRPEEMQLARQQAMVDALRSQSMKPLQGEQVGRVYVAPSIAQGIAQLATAYGARKGQEKFDVDFGKFNERQRQDIVNLRNRMAAQSARVPGAMPQGGKSPFDLNEDDFRYGPGGR